MDILNEHEIQFIVKDKYMRNPNPQRTQIYGPTMDILRVFEGEKGLSKSHRCLLVYHLQDCKLCK